MTKNELITIRTIVKEDEPFIFSTMLLGLWYGEFYYHHIPKTIFMENYHKVIDLLLKKCTVKIACLKEDNDVILGYSLSEGDILHYVFVKSAWRKIGLAKDLVSKDTKKVTHLTKVGVSILNKHKGAIYDPFLL